MVNKKLNFYFGLCIMVFVGAGCANHSRSFEAPGGKYILVDNPGIHAEIDLVHPLGDSPILKTLFVNLSLKDSICIYKPLIPNDSNIGEWVIEIIDRNGDIPFIYPERSSISSDYVAGERTSIPYVVPENVIENFIIIAPGDTLFSFLNLINYYDSSILRESFPLGFTIQYRSNMPFRLIKNNIMVSKLLNTKPERRQVNRPMRGEAYFRVFSTTIAKR